MFDLVISKGARYQKHGLLDVGMHIKPSSQGKSLCSSSWHQPSIHRSWPVSRLLHFSRCVTGPREFLDASIRMLDKLVISSPHHPCVEYLCEAIVSGSHRQSGNGERVPSVSGTSLCSRIILPWHPCFSKLQRALANTHRLFDEQGFPDLKPVIVCSLGGRSVLRKVQAISKKKVAEYGSGR